MVFFPLIEGGGCILLAMLYLTVQSSMSMSCSMEQGVHALWPHGRLPWISGNFGNRLSDPLPMGKDGRNQTKHCKTADNAAITGMSVQCCMLNVRHNFPARSHHLAILAGAGIQEVVSNKSSGQGG